MPNRVLIVDADKCGGCRTCEIVCSTKHERAANPLQSRIKVIKWGKEGEQFQTVCVQCENAPCKAICPASAINRDEALGRVMIDYDRCIGCRMCLAVCPFGLIDYDTISRRVIKCDLCEGDPLCVKFCIREAIRYVDAPDMANERRRASARQRLDFDR